MKSRRCPKCGKFLWRCATNCRGQTEHHCTTKCQYHEIVGKDGGLMVISFHRDGLYGDMNFSRDGERLAISGDVTDNWIISLGKGEKAKLKEFLEAG